MENNYQNIIPGNQTTPKPQIGAMVTLSYIVANIQNELDDYSPQVYNRAMQIIIDGVREMRLYHQASIQVAYLVIPDSGIVPFPTDYLHYTKIGIPINGQLITLGVNENMILNRATKCGEDLRKMREFSNQYFPAIGDGYFFAPHYRGYTYVGALYGAGGGFNTAYYRIDEAAQQIQFDGLIPRISEERIVVMEYASTGITSGAVISAECIEPLKNWYYYKSSRHNPNISMNQKMLYKEDYEASVMRMRAYTQQISMSEFLDTLYKNYKQSPKI